MSDANEKLKYESPILVPLGALAKGSGVCTTGSGVVGNGNGNDNGDDNGNGACSVGNGQSGPYSTATCSAGDSPADYCTAGTCATQLAASYCTAGFSAAAACTTSGFTATGGACMAGSAGSSCVNGDSAG